MNEQATEGVIENTEPTQDSVSDSSPESTNTEEAQQTEGDAPVQAQQPNNKEINFKKLRESVNRLEAERKQWLAERESLQGASQIDQMLRKDPKAGLKQIAQALGVDLKTLIENVAPQSEIPQINFEQYEPETAKLLKFLHDRASKVEKLEQWKNDFEQKIEQRQKQSEESTIERNMSTLEDRFFGDVVKEGFLDKDGKGDMNLVGLIRDALMAKLAQHGDPRQASGEQYEAALQQVLKGLSGYKNKTLQTTVTKSVPSSGSKNGSATTAKPIVTKEQRIAALVDAAKGNGSWQFE